MAVAQHDPDLPRWDDDYQGDDPLESPPDSATYGHVGPDTPSLTNAEIIAQMESGEPVPGAPYTHNQEARAQNGRSLLVIGFVALIVLWGWAT